ncbi:hypothetical protein D3C76_1453000 [compost metagenome]
MKQKVRTSQVSWITLTQRTMWRPLAQVWVLTGLRKLDMLVSTADCGLMLAILLKLHGGHIPIRDIGVLIATSPLRQGLARRKRI